jgi:hypothetical protein
MLCCNEPGEPLHQIGGELKIPCSRYVPVRRNFAVLCVFGESKINNLRVFNPPEYLDSYRLYAVRSSASSISTPISAAALKSSHVALTAPFGS